jgi:hypothetical protein
MTRLGTTLRSDLYIYEIGGGYNTVCNHLETFLLLLWYQSFSTVPPLGPVSWRRYANNFGNLCWLYRFHTVQAIVFLAPLAFNQVLEDNPRVLQLVRILFGNIIFISYPLIRRNRKNLLSYGKMSAPAPTLNIQPSFSFWTRCVP